MKGKPWTNDDEKELRKLFREKLSIPQIAKRMKKSISAVDMKCRRLGLVEEEGCKINPSSSSLVLPKELPTVEEILISKSKEAEIESEASENVSIGTPLATHEKI